MHRAELILDDEADERAPGGAVTVALCGHWDHEGPCQWPHNNAIDDVGLSRNLGGKLGRKLGRNVGGGAS